MTKYLTTERDLAAFTFDRAAVAQAREVAGALLSCDFEAARTDFAAAGEYLGELTSSLCTIATQLAAALPRYGDTRILRDENGAYPSRHLADALIQLYEVRAAYIDAGNALISYQRAIKAITVAADANAHEMCEGVRR